MPVPAKQFDVSMCVAVMLLCEEAKSTVYALPPVGWQSAAVSQQYNVTAPVN